MSVSENIVQASSSYSLQVNFNLSN